MSLASAAGDAAAAAEASSGAPAAAAGLLARALLSAGALSGAAGARDGAAHAWGTIAVGALGGRLALLDAGGVWMALRGAALLDIKATPGWLAEWCAALESAGDWHGGGGDDGDEPGAQVTAGSGVVAGPEAAGRGVALSHALRMMAAARWGESDAEDAALRARVGEALAALRELMDAG